MSDEPTTSGQSAPAANEEVEKKIEGTSTAAEASEAPASAADNAKPSESDAPAKDSTEAQKENIKKTDSDTKDAESSGKTDEPSKDEDADVEMKDTTDAPEAKEASGSVAATDADAADATADKSKSRRRSSGVPEHKGKKLSKKASKAKFFHTNAQPGDHFLVKLKGYPQWPVIVCDEEMLPETLLKSRPVTARRADGTYREDYADGGKRQNDRTFPVMYLRTNEFGWVPNSALQELSSDKATELLTDKVKKIELRDAFELAIEQHPLDYYKDELQKYQDELAQKQAAKDARDAAKKNKKKAPAVIEDEDVDMDDAADEEVAEPKEKIKTKKRKADEEAVSTPARTDSAKKPKIKLNTSSTPKTTNGTATPKSGKESAAKPAKVKSSKKDGAEKKAEKEAPKEPELTAEEKHHRKEASQDPVHSLFNTNSYLQKEVLFLRHKLQKGLLTRDQEPKEEEMKMMSDYITKLESFADLEVSIIRATKINKVLKAILKLDSIPKEEEFNFKSRSQTLLDKWTKILAAGDAAAASVTPAPTNGVNGTKSEEKKETPATSEGAKEESKGVEKSDEAGKPSDKEEKDKKSVEPEKAEEVLEKADEPAEKPAEEVNGSVS
ncbi:PX domain-containing protein [Colletotrichum spaethianum]|uniref:PX domain-containing protein n=1 Tax=Colletotrichum spaethianum TaxID=700344 RepID=A0AA37L5L4_9PEZI|nr:PX domain-containing protein [Colletotrichum spaethianum]GKT42166.1 PX domain-containing protein [Colletotrichum spaethianum]